MVKGSIMEMYRSNTLGNTKNTTGDARGLAVIAEPNPVIGNGNSIPDPSYSDIILGVTKPNINSSIKNLINISVLPINSVIINTDGVSPQGQGQQLKLTFSGKYDPFGIIAPGTEVLKTEILGVPVELSIENSTLDVVEAFFKSATNLVDKGVYFSNVSMVGTSEPHAILVELITPDLYTPITQQVGNQLVIDFEEVSPAKLGYGVWDLIGSETKTFSGVEAPQELYYFKRIA